MWIRFPLGLINDCLEIDKIYLQIILIKTPLYKVTGPHSPLLGVWSETERIYGEGEVHCCHQMAMSHH